MVCCHNTMTTIEPFLIPPTCAFGVTSVNPQLSDAIVLSHTPYNLSPSLDTPSIAYTSESTLVFLISANSDDCYVHEASATHPPWDTLGLGHWPEIGKDGSDYYGMGLRFAHLTIPKGATIISAYLSFCSIGAYGSNTVNARISGDDEDNALTFSTVANYNARPRTAYVNWPLVGAWSPYGAWTNSPDISAIIQALVNRSGWVSSNACVLFIEDDSSGTSTKYRACHDYDYGDVAKVCKLTVHFSY